MSKYTEFEIQESNIIGNQVRAEFLSNWDKKRQEILDGLDEERITGMGHNKRMAIQRATLFYHESYVEWFGVGTDGLWKLKDLPMPDIEVIHTWLYHLHRIGDELDEFIFNAKGELYYSHDGCTGQIPGLFHYRRKIRSNAIKSDSLHVLFG